MKKLLFLLLMGPLAFAIAAGEPAPSGQSVPGYYGQDLCDATAQDKAFILSELSSNISSFPIQEFSQLYCYPGPGKERYVSGTLALMHSPRDIKYYELYFSAVFSPGGSGNLSYYYQNEMYNFSAVFTQNEDQALDYTLKKMLIDSSIDGLDPVMWVQARDFDRSASTDGITYEENLMIKSNAPLRCLPGRCGPTQPVACSFDNGKLSNYPASFFYEPWCAGFIQLPLSQVRSLVGQFDSISYFSDVMRYQFQGSAKANIGLPALVSRLGEARSICTEYEYKPDCRGYYIPTARFSASAWFSYGNSYASFNMMGNVSGDSELTVYLNGADADKYLEKAKADLESSLSGIGVSARIDLKKSDNIYYAEPMRAVSSSASGETSSGQAASAQATASYSREAAAAEAAAGQATVGHAVDGQAAAGKIGPGVVPPAQAYESYSFTAIVKTPDVPLSGFDKFEGDFYTTYSRDNLNIVIGEPYLSLWEENVSFSPGKVTASIVLGSDSNESASRALSDKLASYGVSASGWSLTSYPLGTSQYGIMYAGKGIAAPAAGGIMATAESVPDASSSRTLGQQSAQGSFSDGFSQAVDAMRQASAPAAKGAAESGARQKAPAIASPSALSKYFIFALAALVIAGLVLAVGRERNVMLNTDSFKALSSESRLSILKSLDQKDKTLTDLANELDLSLPTVKEHMDILLKAGLVLREDTERKWKYFSLTPDARRLLKNN